MQLLSKHSFGKNSDEGYLLIFALSLTSPGWAEWNDFSELVESRLEELGSMRVWRRSAIAPSDSEQSKLYANEEMFCKCEKK